MSISSFKLGDLVSWRMPQQSVYDYHANRSIRFIDRENLIFFELVYTRPDGTVGVKLFQNWSCLVKLGVPMNKLFKIKQPGTSWTDLKYLHETYMHRGQKCYTIPLMEKFEDYLPLAEKDLLARTGTKILVAHSQCHTPVPRHVYLHLRTLRLICIPDHFVIAF